MMEFKIINEALWEDVGKGDITTRFLFPKPIKVKAVIVAKEEGVVCGVDVAEEVFRLAEKEIRINKDKEGKIREDKDEEGEIREDNGIEGKIMVKKRVGDGAMVKKGAVVCAIEGDARAILTGERAALNFLSHLSGIATLTRKYVDRVKPHKAKIFDTRKTTPGLRELEKYAVKCGGGVNHRMGLWDGILVKDNHIRVYGLWFMVYGKKKENLKRIVEKVREGLRRIKKDKEGKIRGDKGGEWEIREDKDKKGKIMEENGKIRGNKGKEKGIRVKNGLKIEVEVENLREFKEALEAEPDIIMLDNMKIGEIRRAVAMRNAVSPKIHRRKPRTWNREHRTLLEVSGGVALENVRAIAKTGVDMISIGALTHSAKALDFSLEIEKD